MVNRAKRPPLIHSLVAVIEKLGVTGIDTTTISSITRASTIALGKEVPISVFTIPDDPYLLKRLIEVEALPIRKDALENIRIGMDISAETLKRRIKDYLDVLPVGMGRLISKALLAYILGSQHKTDSANRIHDDLTREFGPKGRYVFNWITTGYLSDVIFPILDLISKLDEIIGVKKAYAEKLFEISFVEHPGIYLIGIFQTKERVEFEISLQLKRYRKVVVFTRTEERIKFAKEIQKDFVDTKKVRVVNEREYELYGKPAMDYTLEQI